MKWLLLTLIPFGCTTVPKGYKKMGDTRLCHLETLAEKSGGEGSLVPGLNRTFQTTLAIPVDKGTPVNITIVHIQQQKSWLSGTLTGYKADKESGLFVLDKGESLSYTDSTEKPSFIYNCRMDSCTRFATVEGYDVLSDIRKISQWKEHEDLLAKVFKEKVIQPCE